MMKWKEIFTYDPVSALLSSGNPAIAFFTRRDLLDESDLDTELIRELPNARKIVDRQQKDGSWKYARNNAAVRSQENYDQIETFRQLGYLVESFGFDRSCPVVKKAAEFLFSFQTATGDIRGILGNQYSPYYTAAILELLIKSGYIKDERVERAFAWLRSIRQNDGGWAIPLRTVKKKLDVISMKLKPIEPDKSKPSAHLVTGVVLRAYAAHERHRYLPETREAGELLLSSLFKKDNYADRRSADYWLRFTFPFWFTDLISAMDSLSKIGFGEDDPRMNDAVEWLLLHQKENGLWKLKTLKNTKAYQTDLWLSLAICRIIKRLYS